tara:strand:- start:602 stop:1480 length:879 start_codon:yes stop_codon:yes gene_type:complete
MTRHARWVDTSSHKRVFAEERGSGAGIFLLHGLGGTGRSLATSFSGLERDFSLLSIDSIGHGRSVSPVSPLDYSPNLLVSQFLEVLDAFDHETVHVLGYGMGARLALCMAVLFPERLVSSILIAPVLGLTDSDSGEGRRHQDSDKARRIKEGDLKTFQEVLLSEPEAKVPNLEESKRSKGGDSQWLKRSPIGIANSLLALGPGCDLVSREDLQNIRVPMFLLSGDKDHDAVKTAKFLTNYLPVSQNYLLEGCGRAAHVEQNGTVTHLCREFLMRSPQALRKRIEIDTEFLDQ